MAYGQSGHLAICFQQSFGLTSTTSPYFIPLVSESIAESIQQLAETNMYGRLSESPYHEGVHEFSGEIRSEAHPVYLGVLLKAALGQNSVTAQSSVFVHEFLPTQADWDAKAALPPLTMELHRDVGSAFVYSDMLATTLTLEIAHGQLLSAAMEAIGGRFSQKAAFTPTYATGRPWTWDVASATHDGLEINGLRSLTISFENQLASFHTLSGAKTASHIKRNGPQTVKVEGTLLFDDQQMFQAFQGQTERRLHLTLSGEAVSSSNKALLTVDIPRFRVHEMAPQMSGVGQIEVPFTGGGLVDTTSNYALRVTLTNTQASY